MSDKAVYILAASIVIAGFLSGGIYSIAPGDKFDAFKLNKFTGVMVRCDRFGDCE